MSGILRKNLNMMFDGISMAFAYTFFFIMICIAIPIFACASIYTVIKFKLKGE